MPAVTTVLLFALATFLLTVSPGPGVLYVTARSLAQGRRAGFASMFAIAVDATYVLAAAAVSRRFMRSPVAQVRTGRVAAATYVALGLTAAATGVRKP